jgi:hypothetical protein
VFRCGARTPVSHAALGAVSVSTQCIPGASRYQGAVLFYFCVVSDASFMQRIFTETFVGVNPVYSFPLCCFAKFEGSYMLFGVG